MRIGFYAPLKPPGHPVVSGDRQMARLLIEALNQAGHSVFVASNLRIFLKTGDPKVEIELRDAAKIETERLLAHWAANPGTAPEIWFTYHPYYKSPDWLGPSICRVLDIPYVTAEASWAGKRKNGPWADAQRDVGDGVAQACVNFCMTRRDREGLMDVLGDADTLADLAPFINLAGFAAPPRRSSKPARLLTVAMMRDDVKLESYRFLAAALAGMTDIPWQLEVIGDGEARDDVETAFAHLPADRVTWAGICAPEELTAHYGQADIFVWPGIGEAYGMAYLEAQAMGLPVIALNTAGVPAVVANGVSGILTPQDDVSAYGGAIGSLLSDAPRWQIMSAAAIAHVHTLHSLEAAAERLNSGLRRGLNED